jgi:hypothetical protein
MAKPIFIVAYPMDSNLSSERLNEITKGLEIKLHDYHVIGYIASNIEEVQMKTLNADLSEDLDIIELKKEIDSKLFKITK